MLASSRILLLVGLLAGASRGIRIPSPPESPLLESNQAPFQVPPASGRSPRPLVIWHGLGDTAHAEGISGFIDDIKSVHPGIYVHSIQIPEGGSLDDERKAGFFGNMTTQGEEGCEQIRAVEELNGGFDAIGFSQGGLYLRHYAQYCDNPPIRNLITFGTPHYGISALIPCPSPPSLSCLLAARAARLGIYSTYAQSHLVQAQYYRNVERLDEYMESNEFLRDLNSELEGGVGLRSGNGSGDDVMEGEIELKMEMGMKGELSWKQRGGYGLGGLENLIAIMFDADRTVSPAESAHFGTYPEGDLTGQVIPMLDQRLYLEDWIGLRYLNERRGVRLEHCPGEHMDLGSGDCGMRMVRDWLGW